MAPAIGGCPAHLPVGLGLAALIATATRADVRTIAPLWAAFVASTVEGVLVNRRLSKTFAENTFAEYLAKVADRRRNECRSCRESRGAVQLALVVRE